ncbi:alpha/beta hydrolase [Streptomyces sp. NBC_01433]|uniref:alpha/beta hydrolase n=1 Tax=Streptomyces sp. NBC_01433 TaxID=2903864 RepID=UPI0022523E49|nr:alpha/beta hydrolase [Streptomyces sp. NBC_01433]MCX4674715.1 alpha/beta hydrolase [Streptomyces sp. NBC_01433]
MAQRALPLPAARLGRAVLTAGAPPEVSGVVLLLPDGKADSPRRPSPWSYAVQLPFARTLARAGRGDGLAVHVLRYRARGWNGDAAPAADAEWAADEVVRRYGDVPVCLVGHGMGGRAALRAGGHTAVTSVLAMAPWLPEHTPDEPEPEPVKQLVGRRVLIVHGTNDAHTDPELSYRLAERAKKSNRDTCRFEVHSDGHALRQHRSEVEALAADFVRGSLFARSYARPVADALAAPPPLGLRMPLAAGFGRSLRP